MDNFSEEALMSTFDGIENFFDDMPDSSKKFVQSLFSAFDRYMERTYQITFKASPEDEKRYFEEMLTKKKPTKEDREAMRENIKLKIKKYLGKHLIGCSKSLDSPDLAISDKALKEN